MFANRAHSHWIPASLAATVLASVGLEAALAQSDPAILYLADYGQTRGNQRRKDLMVANADGTNRSVIWSRTTAPGISSHAYPRWSPDLDSNPANGFQGTIAIYSGALARPAAAIFLVDVVVAGGVAQGANIREVVATDLDPACGGNVLHPAWSPDLDPVTPGYQGKIAYRGNEPDGTGRVCTIEMSWDGGSVQPTHGPNTSVVLSNAAGWSPTWSPDGQLIAAEGQDGVQIAVLDASTGLVTNALSGLPGDPIFLDWSRTGSRIVYRAYTPQANYQLYTVDVDLGSASNQQVSFESCDQRYPSWSPDDSLVFHKYYYGCGLPGQNYDHIRRLDVSTGVSTTLISQSRVNLGSPDWRRF